MTASRLWRTTSRLLLEHFGEPANLPLQRRVVEDEVVPGEVANHPGERYSEEFGFEARVDGADDFRRADVHGLGVLNDPAGDGEGVVGPDRAFAVRAGCLLVGATISSHSTSSLRQSRFARSGARPR